MKINQGEQSINEELEGTDFIRNQMLVSSILKDKKRHLKRHLSYDNLPVILHNPLGVWLVPGIVNAS